MRGLLCLYFSFRFMKLFCLSVFACLCVWFVSLTHCVFQCTCASSPKVSKLSPELSDLVVYTCSAPFKGFDQAAKRPPFEMSSFSESKALRHIKNSGDLRVLILN